MATSSNLLFQTANAHAGACKILTLALPLPSAIYNGRELIGKTKTFGKAFESICKLLEDGEFEFTVFASESKKYFIILTEFERIDEKANSHPDPKLRRVTGRVNAKSVIDMFKALFSSPSGRFRYFAFVVSAESVKIQDEPIGFSEWHKYVGESDIPDGLKDCELGSSGCRVFIYEYRRRPSDEPVFQRPASFSSKQHMIGAGFVETNSK